MPKLVYIGINLITLGIAIYKCSVLGLLPTTTSDWVHLISVKRVVLSSLVFTHSLKPLEFSTGFVRSA